MKQLVIGVLLFLTFGCEVSNLEPNSNLQQGETPLPEITQDSYRTLNYSDAYLFKSDSSEFQGFTGIVNWDVIIPVIDEAKYTLQSDYVAVFGILENDGFYSYHNQMLGFSPEAVQQANGNVRPYIYEIIDLIGLSDQVKRVAVAYIPDSDKAKEELTTWLHPKSMSAQLDSLMHTKSILPQCSYVCTMVNADQLKSVSSSTDILYCYPVSCSEGDIIVEGSVPGDGGSDFDWPSADTDGSSDSNSGGASSNTGEGASGAPCPPPYECGSPEQAPDEDDSEENEDTLDEDPCETGDENIDDPDVQEALKEIWENSNTEATDQNERKEQGGWIIENPITGNKSFQEFPPSWQRLPCKIQVPESISIPANAIGIIHTHPFTTGEKMYSCLGAPNMAIAEMIANLDTTILNIYDNQPSVDDLEMIKTINEEGFDIEGYIIDEQGIVNYDEETIEDDNDTITTHERCAY